MVSDHPAVFSYLSPQQEIGLACVICDNPFDIPPYGPAAPVGRSDTTGQPLRACIGECAGRAGYVPPAVQLELGAGR
jgi:hypothetical protein